MPLLRRFCALRVQAGCPPPRRNAVLAVTCWLVCTSMSLAGCARPSSTTDESTRDQILLEGRFEAIARPATGRARVIVTGDVYRLELHDVNVRDPGPVHVYLVGAAQVRTTRALEAARLKYDIGLLTEDALQVLALPALPDPQLRSVVLYNPKFGVSLAAASLVSPHERMKTPS